MEFGVQKKKKALLKGWNLIYVDVLVVCFWHSHSQSEFYYGTREGESEKGTQTNALKCVAKRSRRRRKKCPANYNTFNAPSHCHCR